MSAGSASGGNSAPDDVFNITAAQRALSNEQTGRTRRYLVSRGIRTACVIAAIFVPGWPRWVLIAAAVALPYLAVVIANAGRVMTQRQLLKEVWGPSHTEQSHYLRIYMGHLRQKLERDPAQPVHLLTETAVGYRLMR